MTLIWIKHLDFSLNLFIQVPVAAMVGRSWDVFQPLLFGLIGAEITIATLSPSTVGKNHPKSGSALGPPTLKGRGTQNNIFTYLIK